MSARQKLKDRWDKFIKEFDLADIYSGSSAEDKKWYKYAIKNIWKAVLITLGLIYFTFFLISFDNLPTFEQLENPNYHQASIVYARDHSILGKYYNENREFLLYDSLNPYLVKALLATEDSRFYSHSGIDFWAVFRVMFLTVLLQQQEAGGGSTITQQLAKLLFDRPNMAGRSKIVKALLMVRVKFKEWLTAIKLEKRYTKEEIIAMYLNKFDFIYGAHGVQTAAQTYFGKNQKDLTVVEAATLIGMLKNPTRYNPKKFPELARQRRNMVLALMERENVISKKELKNLTAKNLDVSQFRRETHLEGHALHFRAELAKWLKELLDQSTYRKPDGSKYNLYQDGLKIYTTIDTAYQRLAEEAAREHMYRVQKNYFAVWKTADPWTIEADENLLNIRKESLNNMIRETEIYQNLWSKFFGNAVLKLEQEIGKVEITDRTIQRLINEENNPGTLAAELKKKAINQKQYDISLKILQSKSWPSIKAAWDYFELEVRKAITKPIKMKVYDFETDDEKEVIMSPLDSIKYHRKHMQIGSVAVDPQTGEVKAWVGGTKFKYFKFDHVNSRRQVGSTFKPFVYATAIAIQGISPCHEFQDIPYTIPANDPNFKLKEAWSPGNAGDVFTGANYTLYRALAESKNSITVKLVMLLGSVEYIRGLLHRMGIDSTARRKDGGLLIPRYPSIVLGSADLSVMEMAGAYTTFANNGVYTKPFFVSRIEDKNGKVIYKHTPVQTTALSPQYNYVMVDLLKKSGGICCVKVPTAGKTGTTNDYVDGWYVGFTPNLVVATWVGGEDPWIRFNSLAMGQGAVMARPFFQKFISKLENTPTAKFNSQVDFYRPPGDLGIELNCAAFKELMGNQNMDNSIMPQTGGHKEDELLDEEKNEQKDQ